MKFFNLIIATCLLYPVNVLAKNNDTNDGVTTIDSLDAMQVNWCNFDELTNKIVGASVDKAYAEILLNKSSQNKIIVAVIDGGVDIFHEDMQGKIWINTNEIPNNGIEDDNIGFIDDEFNMYSQRKEQLPTLKTK